MKLNIPKVDSLRLIIPTHKVTLHPNNKVFLQNLTTINEDAEVIKVTRNNSYGHFDNIVSIKYMYAQSIYKGAQEEVLKLAISSKVLEADYFQGITLNNVDKILQFILNEEVIIITKETLLNARVVDTDICIDMMLKNSNIAEVVSIANNLSIPHKETITNAINKDNNKGIEWGNRERVGEAYKTKQYLKYYGKALELKNNSIKFYDAYIKPQQHLAKLLDIEKLIRIETTIKNKAHWKSYGLKIDTLRDLLQLDLTEHLEVFKRPVNHYMTGIKYIEMKTDLTVTERLHIELVNQLMNNLGLDEMSAIIRVSKIGSPYDKNQRSKLKKKLEKLMNENREMNIDLTNKNQLNIITELEKLSLIPKV